MSIRPQVYPTLVIRGTGLYELWKQGLYRNYSPDKVLLHAIQVPPVCAYSQSQNVTPPADAAQSDDVISVCCQVFCLLRIPERALQVVGTASGCESQC